MSPIPFDLSFRSASQPLFSCWDREHFRLILAYSAAGLLSTQIPNEGQRSCNETSPLGFLMPGAYAFSLRLRKRGYSNLARMRHLRCAPSGLLHFCRNLYCLHKDSMGLGDPNGNRSFFNIQHGKRSSSF
jgi:hypothetical protein